MNAWCPTYTEDEFLHAQYSYVPWASMTNLRTSYICTFLPYTTVPYKIANNTVHHSILQPPGRQTYTSWCSLQPMFIATRIIAAEQMCYSRQMAWPRTFAFTPIQKYPFSCYHTSVQSNYQYCSWNAMLYASLISTTFSCLVVPYTQHYTVWTESSTWTKGNAIEFLTYCSTNSLSSLWPAFSLLPRLHSLRTYYLLNDDQLVYSVVPHVIVNGSHAGR